MFSGNVQKIFDEIMSDKENEKFTKAGTGLQQFVTCKQPLKPYK